MGLVSYQATDVYVGGTLYVNSFTPPAGCVTDTSVSAAADISASKLQHQHQPVIPLCDHATNAAAIRKVVHVVRGSTASLQEMRVGATVAATGNATVTIDLKKNGSSILLSTITLDSSTATNVLKAPSSYTSTDLVQNDVIEVEITAVNAGTGTLSKGVFAVLNIREDAQ